MKRPETHILADESKLKFRQAIHRDWVIREQFPDYGYDFDVQVFDNKTPVPFHFYVQLKATENIKKLKIGFPLPLETKYFKLLAQGPFPVMICLYIKSKDSLYYLWVDDFLSTLDLNGYKDINLQKYKTIYLKKKLAEGNHKRFEEEVKRLNYMRNPNFLSDGIFNIFVKIIPECKKSEEVFKKIFSYFYYKYKIDYFKLLETKDTKIANLIIDLKQKVSNIKYNGESLKIPILLENEKFLPSLAISISFLLLQNGYSNNSADLILKSLSEGITFLDERYLFNMSIFISTILYKGNRGMYILELSESLKKSGRINAAECISTSGNFVVSLDENISRLYKYKYIDFSESLLPLYKSEIAKGVSYYNMANTLSRNLNKFRKSIKYYFKAKKNYTEYKKKSYWWAELAGCFFLINKFKISEKFYKKAIELGEETIPVKALMAGAILYQGRYSEAVREFGLYLEIKDYRESESILKYLLSIFLSHHFEDGSRKINEAIEITENVIKNVVKTNDKNKIIQELKRAIHLDPLCGLAWYNYAVTVSNNKEEDRFLEWLVTSILQPWDLESWTNALCLMIFENIMVEDPTLFGSFASQAIDNFGGSLFISMENILRGQQHIPKNVMGDMISSFRKGMTSISVIYAKEKPHFILRTLKDI